MKRNRQRYHSDDVLFLPLDDEKYRLKVVDCNSAFLSSRKGTKVFKHYQVLPPGQPVLPLVNCPN